MAIWTLPALVSVVGAVGTIVTIETAEAARRKREDEEGEATGTIIEMAKVSPPTISVAQTQEIIQGFPAQPVVVVPGRVPKAPEVSGITMWGNGADIATWEPSYLYSRGCKNFRWGVCIMDLIDTLQQDPESPEWTQDAEKIIMVVSNTLAVGSGVMAKWLLDQLCIRYKWPLKAYQTPARASLAEPGPNAKPWAFPDTRMWAVVRGDAGVLVSIAPPHPFPPVDDWKRVWVSSLRGDTMMTRNDTARIAFWAREDSDSRQIAELLSTDQLRGMLRMSHKYQGSVNAKQLAGADCDKSRWWIARREKATAEYI